LLHGAKKHGRGDEFANRRHPDKNPDQIDAATAKFQQIQSAYQRLKEALENGEDDDVDENDDDEEYWGQEEAFWEQEFVFVRLDCGAVIIIHSSVSLLLHTQRTISLCL
jgi:hypothetical protein